MKPVVTFSILSAVGLFAAGCRQPQNRAEATEKPVVTEESIAADKPFASGGSISIQLDGGSYEVRPAADDRIRVTLSGNIGKANADVTANGPRAEVKVRDTPNNNFHATIEVPKAADVSIRLSGGDLTLAAIAGSKDVEVTGGDVKIAVGDPNDYASVDASVNAGDINADVFGGSRSGLRQRFTWSGSGKRTIRVSLGAGDLVLRRE